MAKKTALEALVEEAKKSLETIFDVSPPDRLEANLRVRRRTIPPGDGRLVGIEEEYATEVSFSVWIAGEGMTRDYEEEQAKKKAAEKAEAERKAAEEKAAAEAEKAAAKAAKKKSK